MFSRQSHRLPLQRWFPLRKQVEHLLHSGKTRLSCMKLHILNATTSHNVTADFCSMAITWNKQVAFPVMAQHCEPVCNLCQASPEAPLKDHFAIGMACLHSMISWPKASLGQMSHPGQDQCLCYENAKHSYRKMCHT